MSTEPSVLHRFHEGLERIAAAHRPSRHTFFGRLARVPREALTAEALGELYTRYQAAMHATRVMVYYVPFLDTPALRTRKLQIFIDDDGLSGGDTHHHQLARAFENAGALLRLTNDDFGELDLLVRHLDPGTARFVDEVRALYARSPGAWCLAEVVSDDWMKALATGLAAFHPAIAREPYFADCFADHVEERHAAESIELSGLVLRKRPELLDRTLADAARMAEALDGLWDALEEVLIDAESRWRRRGHADVALEAGHAP